jgi:hypothetical protein
MCYSGTKWVIVGVTCDGVESSVHHLERISCCVEAFCEVFAVHLCRFGLFEGRFELILLG